jgi:hypothetical protein
MKSQQIKQALQTITALVMTALSLTACNGTTGGYSNGGYSDPYRRAWYDVYGTRCISNGYPMSGCNFYADGSKIQSRQDPYYNSMTLYYDYWSYTDSYGYYRTYNGYAWLSSTGILYDQYGNALNDADSDSSISADVVAAASKQEQEVTRQVGMQFAQKYALAESAGVTIAKTLQDWAVLGKDRARTEADVAITSKKLYGVNLDQAKSAIIEASKGNQRGLEEVNIDVAAHWGTTPETSKEILTSWYKAELAELKN